MGRGDGGYIKVWRRLRRDPLRKKPLSEWEAWLDLLMLANYEEPNPGIVEKSVRELGTEWGWPRMNVHRFLEKLDRQDYISRVGHKPGHKSGHQTR